MKKLIIAFVLFITLSLPAVAEKALPDGSRNPAALASIGYDIAAGTTIMAAVDPVTRAWLVYPVISATMTVSFAPETDYESIDYAIPPTTCSGANLDPAATSTYFLFTVQPAATATLMLSNDPSAPATLTTGSYCLICSWESHGIETTRFNACNTGAATVSVNIRYGRKP